MIRHCLSCPSDAQRLFAIWHEAVLATHGFLAPADLEEIAAIVRRNYLPIARLDVASDEDEGPLGFMGMTVTHIDSLFVAPEAQRRGVGRHLVALAIARQGAVTVDVNEQNEGAVAFYERLGFVRTGWSPRDEGGRPYPLLHLRSG